MNPRISLVTDTLKVLILKVTLIQLQNICHFNGR